jgi:phosphoribosylanthranilate isomerase
MGEPGLRIKICGVTREVDARGAAAAGADLVGAVLVPGTPRAVLPEAAAALGRAAGLPLVAVVADLSARDAASAARTAAAAVIQLHGDEPPALLRALRERGPWELWKVVRPRTAEEIVASVERYADEADLVLLDRWHPRVLGGMGDRFDWELLEEIRPRLPAGPGLGVAGGLAPGNVAEAVRRLRPAVVDVSSGVERRLREKDPARIRAFVEAAREAEALAAAEAGSPSASTGTPGQAEPGGRR